MWPSKASGGRKPVRPGAIIHRAGRAYARRSPKTRCHFFGVSVSQTPLSSGGIFSVHAS